jgi:putative ATP-dependent endonuclease of the OLD family
MRITRLSIKNFRSIEDLSIDLPPICALIGANNAGKSNILEAVRRVLGSGWVNVNSFAPDDVFMRERDRAVEIICCVDPPLSYQKASGTKPTDIGALQFQYTRYKIGANKGQPRLEQNCLGINGDTAIAMTKPPRQGQRPEFSPLTSISPW